MTRVCLLICYVLLFGVSCVDPYPTPMIPSDAGYLVVEGFINSNGPTTLQLSHTRALQDENGTQLPEKKALVRVEGNDGSSYPLTEQGSGIYTASALSIDGNKKYRVRIRTTDEREYASDFVEVKQTPAIDSIIYELDFEKKGLQFYAYTHDPENVARYYHWEYFETWQYHSAYRTTWDYINGKVVRNYLKENIYDCWITKKSTEIFTTSTTKLSSDVVFRFPLAFLPATSEKLEIGYRILIKQYALTRDAFDYLHELKSNTEQQGSIFDNQPSHLTGNIRCVSNPDESVLGYVGAHGVDEKSIMIVSGGQLPAWFSGRTLFSSCPGPVSLIQPSSNPSIQVYITQLLNAGLYLPADNELYPDLPAFHPKICVDCRAAGGTTAKPDYWPY